MRLYFVRHGESTANLEHVFSNGGLPHPLTAKGLEQAQAVAHALADVPVAHIYASPVLRATQTAQILADNLHAPLQITDALREWSVGTYEGTDDPVGWELHRQVQQDWFSHGLRDNKMPGGESWNEIAARFVPLVDELVQAHGPTSQNMVLVGHGGLYTAMLPAVLLNIDQHFALEHGFSYTAYALAETRPGGLLCLSWCGVTPPAADG